MSRYPQLRSAAIPVLWLVQRHYGWCSPDGLRQAAAVMGVTPAYLESVASFYDLFATSPVGRHRVLVCHNISCWMRGADDRLREFCDATGADHHDADHHGASSPGRRVLRQGLRVPRRLRHRPDGLDRRALLRAARGRRRARRDRGGARRGRAAAGQGDLAAPRRRRAGAATRPTPGGNRRCLRRGSSSATSTIPSWRRSRATAAAAATRALERAFKELDPDELIGDFEDSGLRGRGGAGFSMGKKGSFLPHGEMGKYVCCNADESEPGAFKDRELMMKNPHQLVEGVAIAALARSAPRTRSSSSAASTGRSPTSSTAPSPRPTRRTSSAATSSTPGPGSSSSSTAAPAPTSAARRRRCSTRSRASAATRG